jgi:glycosyltransferase involved in cell wall biosynthesis
MPFKMTFIIGQLGIGGAEKQLYLVTKGLVDRGWQVSVINMSQKEGEYWEHPMTELGITLYKVPPGLNRLRRFLEICRFLKCGSVQLVHSWTLHTNFYAAVGGRLAGIPVRMGSERSNHGSSIKRVGKWYALNLWGHDALVVNSSQEAAYLSSYRPNVRVALVPNGVEMRDKGTSIQEKNDLRERLGIPHDRPAISAVGSLVPGKNFALLIKALSVLAREKIAFTLVLIGDGPLWSDLKQQAASTLSKEAVILTGAMPNAAAWYPAFDLLCMPSSEQEGMPNVIMEASAAGLPVVASMVGGVPDLVEDGVTGFLVQPNDAHSLAQQLKRLLLDSTLRQRMGQAGIDKMRREFSVGTMLTRMTKVYEDAMVAKGLA